MSGCAEVVPVPVPFLSVASGRERSVGVVANARSSFATDPLVTSTHQRFGGADGARRRRPCKATRNRINELGIEARRPESPLCASLSPSSEIPTFAVRGRRPPSPLSEVRREGDGRRSRNALKARRSGAKYVRRIASAGGCREKS